MPFMILFWANLALGYRIVEELNRIQKSLDPAFTQKYRNAVSLIKQFDLTQLNQTKRHQFQQVFERKNMYAMRQKEYFHQQAYYSSTQPYHILVNMELQGTIRIHVNVQDPKNWTFLSVYEQDLTPFFNSTLWKVDVFSLIMGPGVFLIMLTNNGQRTKFSFRYEYIQKINVDKLNIFNHQFQKNLNLSKNLTSLELITELDDGGTMNLVDRKYLQILFTSLLELGLISLLFFMQQYWLGRILQKD